MPTHFWHKTDGSLNNTFFSEKYILTVIRRIDRNKAHGHDQISIRLQFCDKANTVL